ncbi:MAG: TrmB family transcriptional regulator, partial [Candidatus Nanohaloarchaea archaeon]
PRSRAYDVLESLADKGFAVIKSSQPMEYVAIPPNQAIENIKKQHQKELEEKLDKLESFKDSEAVEELEDLCDQGVELVDPADLLQEAREEGVNVKVLAPVTDENRQAYESLKESADIRHLEDKEEFQIPNSRFAIVDNDAVTVAMTEEDVHSTRIPLSGPRAITWRRTRWNRFSTCSGITPGSRNRSRRVLTARSKKIPHSVSRFCMV